jgi:hypothetical protein
MTDLFGPATAEKLECVRREVLKRRQVYPRLIEQKKMSQERADREIQVMDAIVDDYVRAAATGQQVVTASLHKVAAAWEPGAVLHFDLEVAIAGQKLPRVVRFAVPMSPYGLRATAAETKRLIFEHPIDGEKAA